MEVFAAASRPIRVLVVDDERLFAEGLAHLLAQDERIDVVGHALDGAEAVRLTESLRPSIVLMDVSMPRVDGIEATRRIREVRPHTAVLVLTGPDAPDSARRAAEAGAAGYVTKDLASSDLIAAILEVAALASVRR
jgi:DNA-binding NarL/FixJ family response regulator